ITFTNRAAAEMRQRLLRALKAARDCSCPEASHEKLTWELADRALKKHGDHLLRNPAQMAIQTIDSFNAALARKMPWLSRFGSLPEISEDADALYHLGNHPRWLEHLRDRAVLTPHPGEFSFLTGTPVPEIQRQRAELPRTFAQSHGVVVLLKGAPTVVATPEGRAYWNPTGNPGMATGGSGDVLAGLIGALLAQGLSLEEAAWAGAYLHGLAGDLLLQRRTVYALIAEDLPEALGDAFRRIQEADPSLP
ncbi:MAG: NAD(P)H-hydrate dehydratase, partial [Candidatus Hydrothermae bacterium]|nr:NAD(P)H-hydrate dehydratase [Candidatus Hydrothermae bacterium]